MASDKKLEESIIQDLVGKTTLKRKKASIKAREINTVNINEALIKAFEIEKNTKSWMTKLEIIKTLGINKCYKSIPILHNIVFIIDKEFDILTKESSIALVRLTRKALDDVNTVLDIIEKCNYSAKEGALEVLGYDKMVPNYENQRKIIKLSYDFGENRPRGYTDPRYGLAAACAGWNKEITNSFLMDCLESKDVPLEHVSKNSLKGNYIKLR